MAMEPGSGPRSSKIDESPEGGSTSSSDSREVNGDREALKTSDTTSENEERTRVTDEGTRGDATAEFQMVSAHDKSEDSASDNSEDLTSGNSKDSSSEKSEDFAQASKQGGGCLVPPEENVSSEALSLKTNDSRECPSGDPSDQRCMPVSSTGNADDPQTPEDWTMVDAEKTDAGSVGKGEASSQMDKNSETSIEISSCASAREEIPVRSGDTPRGKDLKDDCPVVVAKGSEAEVKLTAENVRKDAQAVDKCDQVTEKVSQSTREGSGKASAAARQGSRRSLVAEKSATSKPALVVSRAQIAMFPVHSKSYKETRNDSKPLGTRTSRSKSFGTVPGSSTSRSDEPEGSNSPKGPSTIEEAPSTLSVSVIHRENASSEAPETVACSKSQMDVSLEDASTVSSSAAQVESREILKVPCAVLNPETDKEVDTSQDPPRTESISDILEVSFSPSAASEAVGSEAQERSTVVSEGPSSAPTSGVDISEEDSTGVLSSLNQKDVDSIADSFSLLSTSSEAQENFSVSTTDAARRVLDSGVSKGVGISADSASAVPSSEAENDIGESSETSNMVPSPEVSKGLCRITDSPSAVPSSEAENEICSRSETSDIVPTPEVSKDIGESTDSSRVPSSEAERGISDSSETSNMVPNPEVAKDVGRTDFPSMVGTSNAAQEIGNSLETSDKVPDSEVPKDLGRGTASPRTGPTSDAEREISESSETSNAEVQKAIGMSADAPSRTSEAVEEVSATSAAPRTVSTSEAKKNLGTSREETLSRTEVPSSGFAPTGLQKKPSQIGEEKVSNSLQRPALQSESPVCGLCEDVSQGRSEGGKVIRVAEENARESDYHLKLALALHYEEKLAEKEKTIDELRKKFELEEGRKNHYKTKCFRLQKAYDEKDTECAKHYETAESYAWSYKSLKEDATREIEEKEMKNRDLRGQLEQVKKENSSLKQQVSLCEQQHGNEQSRGGSYLDDTKAATPALLVSAVNGVKDASNNFVKVLKSFIHPGIDAAQLEDRIGAVSRNGHIKFQYQAFICQLLFRDFERPHAGLSKDLLPPTTYFRQYQMHDLKKTDTVERLLRHDRDIDASLHEFCFDKFVKLLRNIREYLSDEGIELMHLAQNKQHPRESKLYVSFCKLAVSVWLLQRLAFSFLHPAIPFTADKGKPFDMTRMQSVVPLDEPGTDEEVQLRVGFYVLPGFDIGNSAIPCEVYVALK